jgi:hypothetical protein
MASSADLLSGHLAPSGRRAGRLGRALAVSVLVCSILPVVALGPSLLRAPLKLGRELHADAQRLLAAGGHSHAARHTHVTLRAPSKGRR